MLTLLVFICFELRFLDDVGNSNLVKSDENKWCAVSGLVTSNPFSVVIRILCKSTETMQENGAFIAIHYYLIQIKSLSSASDVKMCKKNP